MSRLVKSLMPLALMLGLLSRLEGADGPPKAADVTAAVKKYTGEAKPADLKAIDDLKDSVDVAKLKDGTGLAVVGTTDYKFEWTYTGKKKLEGADLKKLEKAGQDLLSKAITAGKDDLKLKDADLKTATTAAKAATFKFDEGGAVGPMTGVAGELPLASLAVADVKAAVQNYLKVKPDAIKSITGLVHAVDLTSADGVTYDYSTGAPVFGWNYAAKKEKVDDDDKKKIAAALQDVISVALNAEKDKAKKLKPEDLKTATDAAKKAKVEPKPYSRLFELAGDSFKKWVTKHLATQASLVAELKGKVELDSITDAPLLTPTRPTG